MLLKAEEFQAEAIKAGRFNLNDIAAEARQIIADAKLHRSQIISQAERDAVELRERAKNSGHQLGYDAGLAEGAKAGQAEAYEQAKAEFQQHSEELLNMLTEMFGQFDNVKQQLLWHAEQDTVVLALAVAEKVIKQAGVKDRSVAVANVTDALKLIAGGTNVTIRTSPQDVDHLRRLADKGNDVLGEYASIKFETDEAIEPGGCCICTEQGQIDAQLDRQIQNIAAELLMKTTQDAAQQPPVE